MGATYTRQSTFTDGDIITAAHSNDEFNQLLAAFAASTGHTHDGTTAEGGPITKLLGNTLTFGTGADTDVAITFDGNTSDGVLTWKEDEDYFEFSDDILVATAEKLQFRDTAIYINSSTNGQLDLVSDGAVVVDTAGDITLDADGGDIFFKDDGTTFGSATNSSGNLIIKSGTTTAMTFDGANVTFAGTVTIGSAGISEAELEILDGATVTTDELNILDGVTATTSELNIMDGVTATTAELNIMDGDTSATSTTVADADRVVLNDAGTMKQVAVTDLAAYFDDEITAMPNLVTTAATTVGALNSGSITSGFGNIDIGSSTITTTGLITGGSLDIDDVVINGTTIGHTDDTDLITLANGSVTIAGDLTISGDDLTMGTNTSGHIMVADGTNFNPVAVSGDVTIASDGAVTIANDAVETAMVNANVITGQTAETSIDNSNDTLLMHDNSASALRKITVASLSTALGGLSDIVGDTSPQLGGDLDVNGSDIVSTSNGNISLLPNGSGVVVIDGNGSSGGVSISDGSIDIRTGTGSIAQMRFFCESSNQHAQTLKAQPHSANSSSTLTLPASTGTLIGTGDSGTVTNAMLAGSIADSKLSTISTAGKVDIGALEIDGATDIGADLADADLIIVDDGANGTERKSAMSRIPTYVFSKVSGDATVASDGALTIAATSVENSMLAGSIADTKLNTISTADKVSLSALDIDGGSDIGADLTTSDLIVVDDGAGGTNRKAALSRLTTYMTNQGFSTEDPTALAIALG